jgi:hypothetical protein
MSITEEQHIDFIISKIDILLEQQKHGSIRDNLVAISQKQLTLEERKALIFYFYKLYKGYKRIASKSIDNKIIIDEINITPQSLNPELENEVLEIERTTTTEMIKLKMFFAKVIVILSCVGIVGYTILILSINRKADDIFIAISNLFS